MAQYNNELELVLSKTNTNIKETINAGYWNDLIPKNAFISHVLGGLNFKQSIDFLIFGVDARESVAKTTASQTNLGAIGDMTAGEQIYYDPATDKDKNRRLLEDWTNLIVFGIKKRYLTYTEMLNMGAGTTPDGTAAPHKQKVHFLWPGDGSPVNNMVEYSKDNLEVNVRTDWSTRLDLLNQTCKAVDYQFYVTGIGDIVFEFPMYDFFPSDFNPLYDRLYTFSKNLISDNVNDEGGTPISALTVLTKYAWTEYNNNNGQNPYHEVGVQSSAPRRITIFSNALASRIGMHMETHHAIGVKDNNRLIQLGMIEFMKRLANFDSFEFEATYRPYISVNRPLYLVPRARLGITKSVSTTWRLREEVTSTYSLNAVRKKENDGKFRYITGGESMPVSYNAIYTTAYVDGQQWGAYVPGSDQTQPSDGKPQVIPSNGEPPP
jgi:hypothetical protein